MRFSFQALINFVLLLVFVLGLIVFVFWRFGIFKKEADLGEILDIKAKMDFINSYPYQNLMNYFQNLSTTKIEIPGISPEELGRQNLF
jgi:uncharacterized membrane protein